MKKQFKLISKSILLSIVSSTMISTGLILSSCVSNKDDSEDNNNETPNGEIKIEDQSPSTNEVTTDKSLTLYVNVDSTKPVKYQWYVDKNTNKWVVIEGATQNSYSITSDLMQEVTTSTTWKYKAEIYDADDPSIKLTSKVYKVNIKPQETTPNPNPEPSPDPEPNPPSPSPDPEPNPPSPNPTPPSTPNPPSKPDDNQTTSINENSISLNNVGQLLPSQYLADATKSILDISLINQKFNTNKITEVSYVADELNDLTGTLSILMKYKEDSNSKTYKFNFKGLLSFNKDNGYSLEFENASNILNLSAQKITEKQITNKNDFINFVSELNSSNINFKFEYKGISIPLDYLDISGLKIKGFSTDWFTSNNKLTLTFSFQNPKINYFTKTANSNVSLNTFNYPTNLSKDKSMTFYSAADYLLNQITNNNLHQSEKYADYYYYDITENNADDAQLEIAQDKWLDNVTNSLTYEGTNYVYRPILNMSGQTNCSNGSITIDLKMQYEANYSSSNYISQTSKELTIYGFKKYDLNDLFSNGGVDDKFSLYCNPSNYEKNMSYIKKKKDIIVNKINSSGSNNIITFDENVLPKERIKLIIKNVNCKFSNEELIQNENKKYYSNTYTAIETFYISELKTFLQYNKNDDVFQLVVKDFTIYAKSLSDDGYLENTSAMTFNITSPGNSLDKLNER